MNESHGRTHRNSADNSPGRPVETIICQAKRNGNTPAAPGHKLHLVLVKRSQQILLTSMVNTLSETNQAESISMPRTKVGNFHRMPLDYMTCTETCGNGVQIPGWRIILPLPEMGVLIKTMKVHPALCGVGHGTSHQSSVGAQRGYAYRNLKQMSLWDFEWFVKKSELTKVISFVSSASVPTRKSETSIYLDQTDAEVVLSVKIQYSMRERHAWTNKTKGVQTWQTVFIKSSS